MKAPTRGRPCPCHSGAALLLVALLAPAPARVARAQTTTGPSLAANDFLIELWQQSGESWARLSDFQSQLFFNKARCECDEPVRIAIGLTAAGKSKIQALGRGTLSVLVGPAACVSANDAARSTANCTYLLSGANLAELPRVPRRNIDTTVRALFGDCSEVKRQENVRLFIDVDRNQIPDLTDDSAPTLALQLDSEPPPAPTGVTIRGGNEALQVAWDSLQGYEDFQGYLVFCSRGGDLPVYAQSGYVRQYHTALTRCGRTPGGGASATGATPSTATLLAAAQSSDPGAESGRGPLAAPAHFVNLVPAYLCSDLLPTSTSHRVTGLQNGIPYLVGVTTVDRHGNASPIAEVYLQAPIPTRDFYSGYREAGGQAEGGYCALARARAPRSRAPFAFVLGAGLSLALRALRRRRRDGPAGRRAGPSRC